MAISAADILAAIDVLRQAQEESDDIEFGRAVELREAVRTLRKEGATTISMLETEMLRQCEAGSVTHDGVQYLAINDNVDRWEHDTVEAAVVAEARQRAIDRETGEIDAGEAARQAAHLMRQVYVAPSTRGRKGALEALGVDDAIRKERKGRRLYEVDEGSRD